MGNRGLASAVAIGVVLLSSATCARAATIPVKTTSDSYGGTVCSLRNAVQAVDNQAAFGGCSAGKGSNTISLKAGTYKLTIKPTGSDPNSSGDLNIDKSVTVTGAGVGKTTIDAGKIDRIFSISTGTSVAISDLTLTHGQALAGANGTSAPTAGSAR